MDKWEYKILKMKKGTMAEGVIDEQGLEKMINHLGSNGWEVISTSPIAFGDGDTYFLCVFLKRKLK
jgi:hypothetical protein